jgi:hypothetical protein
MKDKVASPVVPIDWMPTASCKVVASQEQGFSKAPLDGQGSSRGAAKTAERTSKSPETAGALCGLCGSA